jgi:hypothetical protein
MFAKLSVGALVLILSSAARAQMTVPSWVGRAPEMERLLILEGTWKFAPETYSQKRKEWTPAAPFYATFAARFGGFYLESEQIMPLGEGVAFRNGLILSYDKFRKVYRMVALENFVGLIDVYEGQFDGDTLVVDNERSGTSAPNVAGRLEFARFSIQLVSADLVQIDLQTKRDGQWRDGLRLRLERQRATP